MAPLFFKIFQKYTPGVSSVNSQHLSVVFAYGHTTLSTPDLVRSRKLSRVGLVSTWMGDRLGIPGAVSFCFSFTGQLTHFSKLQHSCVLLYPFNLIAASFCLLTSLWLLSAFGVTKDSSASSFFISPPGGDRQAFFVNYVGDVPS